MCAGTAHSIYMPLGNWCVWSEDYLSLLQAKEGKVLYVSPRKCMGTQEYLARQEFLRSYQFCVEETFKDKLRRSVRRLNEKSLDEIVKPTLRKWMRVTKDFLSRHYKVVERKTKQRMNLLPVASLRGKQVQENLLVSNYRGVRCGETVYL